MIKESLIRLQYLCDTIPLIWENISEAEWDAKPKPDAWSKKEILGHLVDSATNNHQRFVRGQFENVPTIIYNADDWNFHSHYSQMSSAHLVSFWTIYNRHLIEIIKAMPEENYSKKCNTNEAQPVTLEWLIDDYIVHLEHHLKQIANY